MDCASCLRGTRVGRSGFDNMHDCCQCEAMHCCNQHSACKPLGFSCDARNPSWRRTGTAAAGTSTCCAYCCAWPPSMAWLAMALCAHCGTCCWLGMPYPCCPATHCKLIQVCVQHLQAVMRLSSCTPVVASAVSLAHNHPGADSFCINLLMCQRGVSMTGPEWLLRDTL